MSSILSELKEFKESLSRWQEKKLKEYDGANPEIKAKRNEKYGGRKGYENWLKARCEKQYQQAEQKISRNALLKCVDPKIVKFKSWLHSNGIQINPAVGFPMYFNGVRGIGTKAVVKKGTPLFKIPLTRAIDISTALRSDIGYVFKSQSWSDCFGNDLGVDGWLPVIILLAHEKMKMLLFEKDKVKREETTTASKKNKSKKGKKKKKNQKKSPQPSFYEPWLSVMPESYEGSTTLWSKTELAELHCPEAADAAKKASLLRRETWKKLCKYLSDGLHNCKENNQLRHPSFTFALFEWAWCTVDSRVGRLGGGVAEDEGEDGVVRVLPFFGMMNHRSTNLSNSTQPNFAFEVCPVPVASIPEYAKEKKKLPALVISAEREYGVNEEIGFLYGAHDNAHLLQTYGFLDVTKNSDHIVCNPHGTAEISLPVRVRSIVKDKLELMKLLATGGSATDVAKGDKKDVNRNDISMLFEEGENTFSSEMRNDDIFQGDHGHIIFGVKTYENDSFSFGLDRDPLAVFRILVATDEELENIADKAAARNGPRGVYDLLSSGPDFMISKQNEKLALQAAAKLIEKRQESFPTTLEEDIERLKNGESEMRLKVALQFRIQMKRILRENFNAFLKGEINL
eukprot:g2166.t1